MPADDETWGRFRALCALGQVAAQTLFSVWVEQAWGQRHLGVGPIRTEIPQDSQKVQKAVAEPAISAPTELQKPEKVQVPDAPMPDAGPPMDLDEPAWGNASFDAAARSALRFAMPHPVSGRRVVCSNEADPESPALFVVEGSADWEGWAVKREVLGRKVNWHLTGPGGETAVVSGKEVEAG